MRIDNRNFELTDPLPELGTTLALQASAGTGKTFAIAVLVLRYVAESEFKLPQLMVVTFSRAATEELRSRIFERLQNASTALDCFLETGVKPSDPIEKHLVNVDLKVVEQRLARINQAISEIDQATISTTHEFCSRMLAELGVLVNHDPLDALSDQIPVLNDECLHDQFLTDSLNGKIDFPFKRANLISQAALRHPNLELYPPADGKYGAHSRFGNAVRRRVDLMKKRRNIMSFDDIVLRLEAALNDPFTSEAATALLAARFPVVMVDEFQDTDPSQWQIISKAFHHRSAVIIIGDPKQSIYLFRNADITSYQAAVRSADLKQTLGTNFRSDRILVAAISKLFEGVNLGLGESVNPVSAKQQAPRLRATDPLGSLRAPIQIRNFQPSEKQRYLNAVLHQDVANVVVELLSSGLEIRVEDGWRSVQPQDIAVLVHARKDAKDIHERIINAGVNSVYFGEKSVFHTEATSDWITLLTALISPGSESFGKLLLTRLFKITIGSGPEVKDVRNQLSNLLANLSYSIEQDGVASILAKLNARGKLFDSLNDSEGLRYTTDLRHIAELSHRAQIRSRLSTAEVLAWVQAQQLFTDDSDQTDQVRRLDSERKAVTVRTLHSSKGLQFPIVLLPTVGKQRIWSGKSTTIREQWDLGTITEVLGRRVVEVLGGPPNETSERLTTGKKLNWEEDLRLAYVGFTRAESRVIAWWRAHRGSTLDSLLNARNFKTPLSRGPVETPTNVNTLLPPELVEFVSLPVGEKLSLPSDPRPEVRLEAPSFTRKIDQNFTRTSYSALTASSHSTAGPFTAPSEEFDEIEPDFPTAIGFAPSSEDQVNLRNSDLETGTGSELSNADLAQVANPSKIIDRVSLMSQLPSGTSFGSLVHEVLEQVDPSSASLPDDLAKATHDALLDYPVSGLATDSLVVALEAALTTPLGNLTDGRSLADLGAKQRLAELDFEIPLGGINQSTVLDIAQLFEDPSLIPPNDPLASYGAFLADSVAAEKVLSGFLTGSIDAVLEIPSNPPRYVVVDYKTNRAPEAYERELLVSDYQLPQMVDMMISAHYPLQALIYSAALHRMLRLRLTDYCPKTHLGGVGYLFLRGMCGPDTPVYQSIPNGVMTWYPSAELVVAVSKLLAGRNPNGVDE